jgi:glucokinase
MADNTWAIGIDLGATKIKVAGVDCKGKVLGCLRRDTDSTAGPEKIEMGIIEMARELVKSTGRRPACAGVGMAGQIDPASGTVVFAPNLDWHNIPLQEGLAVGLELPVAVTNDVRAAAWGEWLYGAGRTYNDIVCVFAGTGIGGGIVSNGSMLAGCSNTAGEIGHLTIDRNGPRCHCHNYGCLESLAGGWAIARDAQEAVARDPAAGAAMVGLAGGNTKDITAKVVSTASHLGDALASRIIKGAADALVAGCVSLVNAFNPCVLILGGGVVEGMPELVGMVDAGVHSRALGAATGKLKVVQAELHGDAGIIGAAAFAMHILSGKGGKR